MTLPTSSDNCPRKAEGPTKSYHRHCEERSDVAISWYCAQIRTMYQEIATARWASQ